MKTHRRPDELLRRLPSGRAQQGDALHRRAGDHALALHPARLAAHRCRRRDHHRGDGRSPRSCSSTTSSSTCRSRSPCWCSPAHCVWVGQPASPHWAPCRLDLVRACCSSAAGSCSSSATCFEGRKPALADNLFQIFVAPIFLAAEVFFALGYKPRCTERVSERAQLSRAQSAESSNSLPRTSSRSGASGSRST